MVSISGSHETIVSWRTMFGEVVSKSGMFSSPVYEKFSLANVIFDPVEVHIHCFSSFDLDGEIGEGNYGGVVSLYWGQGLMMTDFLGVTRSGIEV